MAENKQHESENMPQVSRPKIPGYGVPENDDGLLPWSHVVARLEQARNYWVGTVSSTGRPHAVPVWGAWVDGRLYFGAGPRSARNLAANPEVVINLESGDDVVIIEGSVEEVSGADPEFTARYADIFAAKYEWRPDEVGGYVLLPRVAYAWTKFPGDSTRWRWPVKKDQ